MKSQQGIALITILVMVAMATILAASIVKHQLNTADNTAYLMRQNQSLLYAQSVEAFFSELLVQDAKTKASVDHLGESWAQPMPNFPIENGFISGRLQDESGKFNLNNLVNSDGTVNEYAKQFFEKLLVRVGLSAELSQAVIDWEDADDQTSGSFGAENAYYQGLSTPYLAANTPFFSVAELKKVRGFEGENFRLIEPYITALPSRELTKMNINTAPALVLASIDPQLNAELIQQELQVKFANMQYFQQVNELWALDAFKNVDAATKQQMAALFDVKSHFFKANIKVTLDQRQRNLNSYFMRENQQVYVYARDLLPN